jgi:hypothetical protein
MQEAVLADHFEHHPLRERTRILSDAKMIVNSPHFRRLRARNT